MSTEIQDVEQRDIAVDTEDREAYELARMRHSAAHLMAEAVQEIFPDARFGIGPAIDNGFYYDFELPRPLTPDDLKEIEKRMIKHKNKGEVFEKKVVSREEAMEIFGEILKRGAMFYPDADDTSQGHQRIHRIVPLSES